MLSSFPPRDTRKLPDFVEGILDITDISSGFIPAFKNNQDDETHLSIDLDGRIAEAHNIDNVPIEWVAQWDEKGFARALIPEIVPGYMRAGRFYTIYEIMCMPLDS